MGNLQTSLAEPLKGTFAGHRCVSGAQNTFLIFPIKTPHKPIDFGSHGVLFWWGLHISAMGWSANGRLYFCLSASSTGGVLFVKLGWAVFRVKLLVRCMVYNSNSSWTTIANSFVVFGPLYFDTSPKLMDLQGCYIVWPMHMKEALDTLDWKTVKKHIYSLVVYQMWWVRRFQQQQQDTWKLVCLCEILSLFVTTFRTSKHVQDAAVETVETGDSRSLWSLCSLWSLWSLWNLD